MTLEDEIENKSNNKEREERGKITLGEEEKPEKKDGKPGKSKYIEREERINDVKRNVKKARRGPG